jgi:tRNA-Thr(GGU) m(6)t(6)A37 methyltransferase TsaA
MKGLLKSIGRIRTPYTSLEQCPSNIDPDGPLCELRIDEAFVQGLTGLVAGQHILLLYWFEPVDRALLVQKRRKSGQASGVFALRSPHRPNPIGAAVVRIESITRDRIRVRGMDCLDGTPLLDIKPATSNEQP